jgi:lysozyme family protein
MTPAPLAGAFAAALKFTLAQEGGWSNDPLDPGGATQEGITLAVFRHWRHDQATTPEQLRGIEGAEVAALYRSLFWNTVRGSVLPRGASLSIFDFAVNAGVRRAAMELQGILGVEQDGAIGPLTIAAVNRADVGTLLAGYASAREAFYRACYQFHTFGAGWDARNHRCYEASCAEAGVPVRAFGGPAAGRTPQAAPAPAPQSEADALMQDYNPLAGVS